LCPTPEAEAVAAQARPSWAPDNELPNNPRDFKTPNYGLRTFADLFTRRQLVALTTFSDLVLEARERIIADAKAAGFRTGGERLRDGGIGVEAYGDAVAVYLAFALDKAVEASTTICTWSSAPKNELVVSTFRRQALPMTWDYAEANPFADSSGSFDKVVEYVAKVAASLPGNPSTPGIANQTDAMAAVSNNSPVIISSDPPYYDNIGYADLADFFYVWMRRTLRSVYPGLFDTLLVPTGTSARGGIWAKWMRRGANPQAKKRSGREMARGGMGKRVAT
jgi:putative DNA methylase